VIFRIETSQGELVSVIGYRLWVARRVAQGYARMYDRRMFVVIHDDGTRVYEVRP
jgi:hypothetical protein